MKRRYNQSVCFVIKMDTVINLNVPHIAFQIFDHLDVFKLFKLRLSVSTVWKELITTFLIEKWLRHTIILACASGQIDLIEKSLEFCAKKNIRWSSIEWRPMLDHPTPERTPFMIACWHACRNGRLGVVKLLLEHRKVLDIKVVSQDVSGHTELSDACYNQQVKMVRLLLNELGKEYDTQYLNAQSLKGETAFMRACEVGNYDIVKMLLDYGNGIDFNLGRNNNGLMLACQNGHAEVVALLMQYSFANRIELNRRNAFRKSALMMACEHGHEDIVKLMLESKLIDRLFWFETLNYSQKIKDLLETGGKVYSSNWRPWE